MSMICRRWMVAVFAAVGLLFCIQSSVSARAIRVKLNGAEVGDGATWASALRSLSDALDAAESGDEIWVGMGSYTGPFTIKAACRSMAVSRGLRNRRSEILAGHENWLCETGCVESLVRAGCGRDTSWTVSRVGGIGRVSEEASCVTEHRTQ